MKRKKDLIGIGLVVLLLITVCAPAVNAQAIVKGYVLQ